MAAIAYCQLGNMPDCSFGLAARMAAVKPTCEQGETQARQNSMIEMCAWKAAAQSPTTIHARALSDMLLVCLPPVTV
jgi:hypothetical protein